MGGEERGRESRGGMSQAEPTSVQPRAATAARTVTGDGGGPRDGGVGSGAEAPESPGSDAGVGARCVANSDWPNLINVE